MREKFHPSPSMVFESARKALAELIGVSIEALDEMSDAHVVELLADPDVTSTPGHGGIYACGESQLCDSLKQEATGLAPWCVTRQ